MFQRRPLPSKKTKETITIPRVSKPSNTHEENYFGKFLKENSWNAIATARQVEEEYENTLKPYGPASFPAR